MQWSWAPLHRLSIYRITSPGGNEMAWCQAHLRGGQLPNDGRQHWGDHARQLRQHQVLQCGSKGSDEARFDVQAGDAQRLQRCRSLAGPAEDASQQRVSNLPPHGNPMTYQRSWFAPHGLSYSMPDCMLHTRLQLSRQKDDIHRLVHLFGVNNTPLLLEQLRPCALPDPCTREAVRHAATSPTFNTQSTSHDIF